jgi:hypothetical protein
MTSVARPRLLCEFPAGLASVSLRLQGGAHCRPPISRMGNKAGYGKVILATLGLHSGQGADGYWWAEADRDVAALLRIYADPVALRAVARIIRWWSDEEPRDLWERLRAERTARIAAGTDRSDPQGNMAEWLYVAGNTAPHADAWKTVPRSAVACGVQANLSPSGLSDRAAHLSTCGWPTVRVSLSIPTAAEVSAAIGTPGDLGGCIIYSDPPYINTTGYGHDLPRAAVVEMAREFAAMGATVAISEQTPIEELDGWESVEITDGRVGQKRTFSAQKREFITLNRTPGFTIAKQSNLFGVSE